MTQAGHLALADAVDDYPELAPDFMHDVALNRGMSFETAVGQDWFMNALPKKIMSEWPEAARSPVP